MRVQDGQIVLIGDSMVEYYEVDEYFDYDDVHVYNRGIAGETSSEMLVRFKDDALDLKPHILFIGIGTNDIATKETDSTLANIESAIKRAKEAGIEHILLSSLFPINTDICAYLAPDINDVISGMTSMYKMFALGMKVDFVDFYPHFRDDAGMMRRDLTYDGIHLSAKGYDIYTSILKPYIMKYLNDKH